MCSVQSFVLIPNELKKSCFTVRKAKKESLGVLTKTSVQDRHVVLPNCFTSTKSLSQTLQQVKYHQHQVSNKQDTLFSNTNLAFSLQTLFQINQHHLFFSSSCTLHKYLHLYEVCNSGKSLVEFSIYLEKYKRQRKITFLDCDYRLGKKNKLIKLTRRAVMTYKQA